MGHGQLKANLRIRLLADGVLVGETDDPGLWQTVLAKITVAERDATGGPADPPRIPDESEDAPVFCLANELTLSVTTVQAALAPSKEAPFLHLDSRTWEAFKKNFPSRGSGSVSPIALALTALACWFRCLDADPPTIAQAHAVIGTIHVTDKNARRSVRNCNWLQQRGNNVIVNPAEITQAISVLQAYCTKEPPQKKS